MRVGIDCRKIADFGIGTYIRGLLHAMTGIDYVAFGPREIAPMLPAGVEHIVANPPKYSLRELFAFRDLRVDLFHAPHYVVPFVKVPVVVTIHDLIHLRHRNPLARAYARTMIGRAVTRSRAVITVSDAVRREIESVFGRSDIAVIPNGVDPTFTPDGPRAEGRYFLFVGNEKPHKNVARAIAAAQSIDVELIRAGSSRFVSGEELAALYRGAIALVMPSIEEGFGLPALEAMTCGTAVITSKAPPLVEITGDAAMHVDAMSVDAIATAMQRVMDDENARRSMIEAGFARAKKFSWQRCAEMTREIYRRIA
ncbi:MAG TPA: glycosyltransferase family 1 protein [Thermoanaerobaculia bacterium]|nr:glycosyltransferase family 1 protein [Thermoanaerobaculia bacterium]